MIPMRSVPRLTEAKAVTGQPTLIIGKTVMGKGARKADDSSYERNCATHGAPLGGDAYINTIKNLGGDLATNPSQIFPEVKDDYAKRAEELKKIVAERYAAKAEWTKANPELAAKLDLWFSGKAPQSRLECYRTESRMPLHARISHSSRSTSYRSRKHDYFFAACPTRQNRRFVEENPCIHLR